MEHTVVGRAGGCRLSRVRRLHAEQFAAAVKLAFALVIAEEAEVADAVKAIGQHVDEEAAE